jgi:hypothetical protein
MHKIRSHSGRNWTYKKKGAESSTANGHASESDVEALMLNMIARRERLQAEIAAIEEFIAAGEQLVKAAGK